MKRLALLAILLLASVAVHAQTPTTTQNARRLPNGNGAPTGACVAGPPFIQTYIDSSTTPPTTYYCKSGTWTASSGAGASAPKDATYVTETANSTLTNEFALGSLATGLLKNTTTTGVPSVIVPGTGVEAALQVNVGSAGAPVLFNGAGGTPSSITLTNGTGLPTTGLSGTLQAAQEPAHTGDVQNTAGSLALTIQPNAVTLAKMATQATNTVLGNATSGTAVPTALAVGSCSTAGSALIWTTNTGFGCNTSIAANTATTATDTASKSGTGSTYPTTASPTIDSPVFTTQASAYAAVPVINIFRSTADATSAGALRWLTSTGTTKWEIGSQGAFAGSNLEINEGASASNRLLFTAGTGNMKLGGSNAARGTTEGTNHLDIFNGTAPVGTLANGVSLYSTSGELRVMDSGGTATLLSSHSRVTGEWIHDSYSAIQKKRLIVQAEEMSKFIDAKFGTHFVQEIYDDPTRNDATINTTIGPVPANIGGTQVLTPTPGATVTLTIDSTAKHIVASWTSGEAETINVSGTPQDGAQLTLVVTNDGVLGRLLTTGTGLSALSTILNVISKKSTVSFVALNGTFYEVGRTVGF